MKETVPGIHHITAIAGPPQPNLDFYAGVLGLRLVKRTVNFDDPGTYHLYYGDDIGRPGTALTFFPWPDGRRGQPGTGQAVVISFSVPEGAVDYWKGRFQKNDRAAEVSENSFGETVVHLRDPDGIELQLITDPSAAKLPAWKKGPVPEEYAIRGFHSTTLCLEGYEQTAELLTETFGYEQTASEDNRFRFRSPAGKRANTIELRCQPQRPKGSMGTGTVHHVAFRVGTEEEQLSWRKKIKKMGFNVTPVIDRQYFQSIYFREPGGVLFEIATEGPGFAADEPVETLGSTLKLPPWLEPERQKLERQLPEIRLPKAAPTEAR